ncbi:DNA-3-methyladenine glycosylase 2 family protein [Tissierella praeacuta]|uniref:DNA-3-methyladenine glycosylase family protein n=1 Tax=Tissierella praeacuta TaxID=43131 RepID=UPI003341CBC9
MSTVKIKYFEYGRTELNYLASIDPVLGAAIRRLGRVERQVIPDIFAALVYTIIGQLVSVRSANTVWSRMQDTFGDITPENLSIYTADHIQACGMTMKKAICIHDITENIVQGQFDLSILNTLSDSEVIKQLISLPGIGRWTAEMILLNCMERPNVVSWGDLAIRRGMKRLYGLQELTKQQFDEYRKLYSPYGSVASIYLWRLSFGHN